MTSKNANAQRIMALFSGNEGHYGTHGTPDLDPNGVKWTIKRTARTLKGPTTELMWCDHIDGKKPLGIVPIKNDGTCVWGSIDIDDYDVDISDVLKKISSAKLPLVPCRSKSGGLHLFLFTKEPVEASLMQSTLRDIAASLGFGSSEIFPKQTRLLTDQGDQGNWIVMPYFGGTFGGKLRYQHGIKKTGADMTINEFLTLCEESRVNPADISLVRAKKPKKERPPFSDGPPCLAHMAALAAGIPQGGQNNTAFHMGVYFKRAFPSDWQQRLEEANQKFMRPPLPSDNLAGVIKSLEKKDYQYKCKDEPMRSHCDAMLCRTRKYGVGAGGTYPVISGLSKLNTEPALWFVEVEGTRISMSTEELQSYPRFHRLCMEFTHKCFMMLRQDVWLGLVSDAMQNMTLIEASADIGIAGRFLELLETFLTNKQRGLTREDMFNNRPWEDEEAGRHYFRLTALQKFMEREGMKDMTRGQITERIRKLGGGGHQFTIKGRNCSTWYVPGEALQKSLEVAPPEIKGEPI